MRKKVLYVIIAVLALILVAGLVFIFTMPKPQMDAQQDTSAAMDATDNTVVTDVPSAPSDVPGTDPTEGKKPTQAQIIGTIIPEPTEETVPEDTRLIPDVPDVSVPEEDEITYLDYHAMSGDEQAAFINTFSSYEAFFAWYNAAEKEYKDSMIEIDNDTSIDMEELFGGN